MARRRTYSDERIFSAVRDLLLAEGPRGVGPRPSAPAAVVRSAPSTTGSRRGRRCGRPALDPHHAASSTSTCSQWREQAEPGIDRAMAATLATIDFAIQRPEDARLLAMASREELPVSDGLTADLIAELDDLNAPAEALAVQLARELYGRASRAAVERVAFAVFGIPYTAVRHRRPRTGTSGRSASWCGPPPGPLSREENLDAPVPPRGRGPRRRRHDRPAGRGRRLPQPGRLPSLRRTRHRRCDPSGRHRRVRGLPVRPGGRDLGRRRARTGLPCRGRRL